MDQPEQFSQRAQYQIRVAGQLDPSWADWFDGFTITPQPTGKTLLTGSVIDQAALYGILAKLRDLRLDLLYLERSAYTSEV